MPARRERKAVYILAKTRGMFQDGAVWRGRHDYMDDHAGSGGCGLPACHYTLL